MTLAPVTEAEAETREPTAEPTIDESFGPHPLPTLPPEALVDDEEGAAAFVEYFGALTDYTATTGDFEAWDRHSHETCDYCESTRTAIAGIWDADYQHFQKPTITEIASVERVTDDGVYEVIADITFGERFDRGPEGNVVNERDDSERRGAFHVEMLDDGTWVVYEAGTLS